MKNLILFFLFLIRLDICSAMNQNRSLLRYEFYDDSYFSNYFDFNRPGIKAVNNEIKKILDQLPVVSEESEESSVNLKKIRESDILFFLTSKEYIPYNRESRIQEWLESSSSQNIEPVPDVTITEDLLDHCDISSLDEYDDEY